MSLVAAFLLGILFSHALEELCLRIALRLFRRFPVQTTIKQHMADKGMDPQQKGKILKVDEWMFKKKVDEGANPFDVHYGE